MGTVTRLGPCSTEEIERLIDQRIDTQLTFDKGDLGDEGAIWCFIQSLIIARRLRHHCRLSDLEIEQLMYDRREARGIPHP